MNREDNDEQKNSFCFDSGPSESSFRVIPPPTAIQCDQMVLIFFMIWLLTTIQIGPKFKTILPKWVQNFAKH